MKLDHVALAVGDPDPVFRALAGELGAVPLWGGEPPGKGFRAAQLRMGVDGMTVEIITPHPSSRDGFLARFLAESGEGPHHLTFKVDDIEAELERLSDLGFEPVNADLTNPVWREAFIHPRQSHGTVIQIAQPGYETPPISEMVEAALRDGPFLMVGERWWDPEAVRVGGEPAVLRRVVIRTPDLEAGSVFYGEVLGGRAVVVDGDRVDVAWEGGTVRLERGSVARPYVDRLEYVGGDGRVRLVGGARLVPERRRLSL